MTLLEQTQRDHMERRKRLWPAPQVQCAQEPKAAEPVPAIAEEPSDLRQEIDALTQALKARLFGYQQWLDDQFAFLGEVNAKRRSISVQKIARTVARYYAIPIDDLMSARREARAVNARYVAMYFARHLTRQTLPCIGRILGGRDHTTILHGIRKIEAALLTDEELQKEIAELMVLLRPVEAA